MVTPFASLITLPAEIVNQALLTARARRISRETTGSQ
jgi:hypothetical protein